MNKLLEILKNKKFILPFVIIALYILIVFVIPMGDSFELSIKTTYGYQRSFTDQFELTPTIFNKRNYNRYKKTILDKRFDNLQAYVIVYDKPLDTFKYGETLDTDIYQIKSEVLNVDSYELFMSLVDAGYFTKESFELIDSVVEGASAKVLTKHAKDRNKLALKYIVQFLPKEWYKQPGDPIGAYFKVKRKFYHYLLL